MYSWFAFARSHTSNVRYIAFSMKTNPADCCCSTLLNIRTLVCICAEPHVASNVRYIAFSMKTNPADYCCSTLLNIRTLVCICAEPHVASNVRYIAFSMWAYAVVQNKGRAFWARPLLFM